ncbi:hypothetical protein LOTGIDRAFT_204264 [Lottia gigantea]|uniref:Uncharacterized protein n=1 Tax=Lottia gigantea TaxID=225164 RepID=V4A9Z9_LOTGI|nr:hypothetical protein LOTGIDRAFT_204264 [Lottia gigantea]ESO90126.1 hypothetical protein LOTGIDRAFT_204264 [Lottia gigantea]
MASECIGSYAGYKYSYNRQTNGEKTNPLEKKNQDSSLVWVTKRYIPTDLRVSAPVPRRKIVTSELPPLDRNWKIASDQSLRSFERRDDRVYLSHPSTRSEEWSTLRQSLPSRGTMFKPNPPNWGSGYSGTSSFSGNRPKRFPLVNSPMTRYVDDMHKTNPLFTLY